MTQKQLVTREEAKASLSYRGKSMTQWAHENGFTLSQVRDVLRKDRPCRIGVSHKIAVLLGIKDGIIDE
jgi:gp16 family phage-associated protein